MDNLLKHKGYFGSIELDTKEDILFGKILGINDLVSYEAKDIKSLKKAFKSAVVDYLETCKELDKEPQKKYNGSFNVRLNPELHRKLQLLSVSKNISMNKLLNEILTQNIG